MSGNSEKIDEIIDTAVTTEQYKILFGQVTSLDDKFVELTKHVMSFVAAASDSKGFSDFNKNAAAAVASSDKLIQTQQQSVIVNIQAKEALAKLETAQNRKSISDNALKKSNDSVATSQEKAAAAAAKALSPYQALSKELDKQRLAAKDLGVQYGLNDPRFLKAQQSVLKLDNQLKTLDKSLGQNQRNVGNYEHDIKTALDAFSEQLDHLVPGAGKVVRTVVEGFSKIGDSVRKSKGDITSFTEGGFGFKPVTGSPLTNFNTTGNTAVEAANTEATVANTAANEANAVSEAHKAEATAGATESTAANTAVTAESSGILETLALGFAAFTTVAFVAAIGAATYYLSEFQSTGNDVEKFIGGLKRQFSNLGQNIIEGLKGFSAKSLLNLIPAVAVYNLGKNSSKAFQEGVDASQVKIDLENASQLDETENAQLRAEAERSRALSKDKLLDISIRQEHLVEAQKVEEKILSNQKENANLYIANAVNLGDRAKKLTDKQVSQLLEGDLKLAQELSQNGTQFTKEGFELYKQGIQKKIEYEQGATNELVKLQADRDNLQLRGDNALAKAQDALETERLRRIQERFKEVLADTQVSNIAKLKANEEYVNASIALIKKQEKTELGNAGIGSARAGTNSAVEAVNRLRITEKTEAEIAKVKTEGLKNLAKIQKDINDSVTKDEKQRLQFAIDAQKALVQNAKQAGNEQLLQIDENYSEQSSKLADQYRDGIITAAQYNQKLLQLQRETSLQRIDAEIETQKKIVVAQAIGLISGVTDPKELQASADTLTRLKIQRSDQLTAVEIDNIHKVEAAESHLSNLREELANAAIDTLKSIVDNGYQAQIDALKLQSQQVSDNADLEKQSVDRSLLSSKQKAQQDKIIDAQAAATKKALAREEAQIKTKQAKFDRVISIAQIFEQIGVAEVGALKYLADPITAPFYPEIAALIGALGLLQLTKVVATPIPKYKGGTWDHVGGLGVVGDGYAPELIMYPNGNTFLSPATPTLLNMPAGTAVIPNVESIPGIRGFGDGDMSMKEVAALLREGNRYQKRIAEKNNGNNARQIADRIIAAQRNQDRRNNYFK